jgi:hypothetical protein
MTTLSQSACPEREEMTTPSLKSQCLDGQGVAVTDEDFSIRLLPGSRSSPEPTRQS